MRARDRKVIDPVFEGERGHVRVHRAGREKDIHVLRGDEAVGEVGGEARSFDVAARGGGAGVVVSAPATIAAKSPWLVPSCSKA